MPPKKPIIDLKAIVDEEIEEPVDTSSRSPKLYNFSYDPNFKMRFVKIQKIGRGVSREVYTAVDAKTFKIVALKVVSVHDFSLWEQSQREISALRNNLKRLTGSTFTDQEPLVTCFGSFYDQGDNTASLVMEYIDGGSLEDYMQSNGPVDEEKIKFIAYDCLRGLFLIHGMHFLHRDMKPSNVLLSTKGYAKISDFGTSKNILAKTQKAEAGDMAGTLLYMAPEVLNAEEATFASDIWSFGMTLLAAAFGEYPLKHITATAAWDVTMLYEYELPQCLRKVRANFSEKCANFIQRCFQSWDRPSAGELLEDPFLLEIDRPVGKAADEFWHFSEPRALNVNIKEIINRIILQRQELGMDEMPHSFQLNALAQKLRFDDDVFVSQFQTQTQTLSTNVDSDKDDDNEDDYVHGFGSRVNGTDAYGDELMLDYKNGHDGSNTKKDISSKEQNGLNSKKKKRNSGGSVGESDFTIEPPSDTKKKNSKFSIGAKSSSSGGRNRSESEPPSRVSRSEFDELEVDGNVTPGNDKEENLNQQQQSKKRDSFSKSFFGWNKKKKI